MSLWRVTMPPLPLLLFAILFALQPALNFAEEKSFIVYFGAHNYKYRSEVSSEDLHYRVTDSHHEFLASFLGSKQKAKDAIFYSYTRHINGFAAILPEERAIEIARHPSVVSVFLNQGRKLHTTRSWDFLLLEKNGVIHSSSLWKKARFGEDTIIANLDTGVWPESKSFADEGYGPIPKRWKGTCQNNTSYGVRCNRKLIGARYFNKGYLAHGGELDPSLNSPRDHDGHGSHTLSTAGGNMVPGANVMGLGNGTAKGGSPKARVAAYKVCWKPINGSECFDADILEAFDSAIHDGVDVISVSLGGDATDYFNDGISIGAFHAVQNGIVVVCSAGNSGPKDGTVSNISPWMITVGASTMDREFEAIVVLRNGIHLKGTSLSKPLPKETFYPLITGAQAKAANASTDDAMLCKEGTLDVEKAKGKILVCLRGITARVDKGRQALLAGAVGMILCNDAASGNEIISDPHVIPASQINFTDGLSVFHYINSTENPEGFIMPPTARVGTKPAPFMASFSSKGPNTITPEILKPDITAPGVNVIAAFSEATSPTDLAFDTRRFPFNVDSGTSMSCPHISGISGLLKTLHPDWSPSAIKSAIMTTARTRDNNERPLLNGSFVKANALSYGAGHVRPNRAADPGLVYDLTTEDYLDFLCATGYNETMIKLFSSGRAYACSSSSSSSSSPSLNTSYLLNFNYPSITVPNLSPAAPLTISRRVKNVGPSPTATYAVRVRNPVGVFVSVEPSTLAFDKIGQEKSFRVTLSLKGAERHRADENATSQDYASGFLLWSDGIHHVRSPIVVAPAAAH